MSLPHPEIAETLGGLQRADEAELRGHRAVGRIPGARLVQTRAQIGEKHPAALGVIPQDTHDLRRQRQA